MIVVTGAAGRLGRMVVQLLVDQDREVLATDQLAADGLPAEFVRCDLVDAKAVEGILKGAEAVVHMGAIPRADAGRPKGHLRQQCGKHFQRHDVGGGAGTASCGVLVQRLRHGVGP